MQTSPLLHHLVDLNSSEADRSGTSVLAPFGATHSASRIAAADAMGFERGVRAADTNLKQALSDQEARLRGEFEAARRRLVEGEARILEAKLEAGIEATRQDTAAAIARTLAPFIAGRLRDQALNDVVAAAEDLVRDSMPTTIEISGPADLMPVLAQRLEPLATVVRVAAVSSPEIRVRVDTRIIETRLSDWVIQIEGALQ